MPVFSFGHGRTHDGQTAVAQYCLDVFKVNVDIPRNGDDLSNTFGSSSQDIIGFCKGCIELEVAVDLAEFIVGNDQNGIYISRISARPLSACSLLLLPSKPKGMVTMPMVSTPISPWQFWQ